MNLTLWSGPVAPFQFPGGIAPSVPGSKVVFVTCTGDGVNGTPKCAAVANSWRGTDGRRLPGMYQKLGLPDEGDLYIGAFSAGGHIWRRVCESAADRRRIKSIQLADGTYTTSWLDASRRIAAPIVEYVDYALDCLSGERLFVATASAVPNKTFASGIETLTAIRLEVERRSGQRFDEVAPPAGVTPAAVRAYQLGGNLFLDYQSLLGHELFRVSPGLWQHVVTPFAEGALGFGRVGLPAWAAFGLGVAGGAGAAALVAHALEQR